MFEVEDDAAFWVIEYERSPNPQGEASGLLCVPLPWEEGDRIEAAVMVFESRALAQAGLDHYIARIGTLRSSDFPYRLL